ncbi:MAG: nuclear transport factor 2 family protein [Gilvibacter sp.]
MNTLKFTFALGLLILLSSCVAKSDKEDALSNETNFTAVLQKHLDAVTNKDLMTLESTMSPDGQMELIQPSSETVYGVEGFMEFHREWFAVPDWTFTTKILSKDVGETIGVATTEILYQEPERNGKPYFNRMNVSYTLQKIDGNWYIIKDHASSIEKTQY